MQGSRPRHSASLLLVDDEENVLHSLRRALRTEPYNIFTAQGGEAALQILSTNTIDLIISDSRMPVMDGPTLLAHVQSEWPDRMRILLTGQPDIRSAIKAINDGRIYRYISKPWDDDELCQTIDEALAYQYLERDRTRLLKLTHDQNIALQKANTNLEARVCERTAELVHTAELLAQAHANLQRSFVTATEAFASLLNHRMPQSRQPNRDVKRLISAFCRTQNLPKVLVDDLVMAAALYNIGKLTWSDTLIAQPVQLLSKEQAAQYRSYPRMGESLLMALEPTDSAANIICHHQERWDGRGFPDGLAGDDIPLGSRILKLAVDCVEMQMGISLKRKLTREEALAAIQKCSGSLYDPSLCKDFIDVVSQIEEDEVAGNSTILTLGVHALEPGMITAKDLHSNGGMLLLKEGVQLTERLIEKLGYFEENENTKYTLHILAANGEEEE
jgi:response regulator RpfG family c-di-GMP phosphodiesterase